MTTQNPDEAAEGREPEPPRPGAVPPAAATTGGATGAATAGSTSGTTDPGHAAHGAEAPEGDEEIWLYEEAHGDPAPRTGVAATFLPGIDAGAVIAAVLAVLGAGVYLLVYPLVQAKSGAASWANYKNKVPQSKQDPFITERLWAQYQSWGHIILGVAAILIALLVLGLWTHEKNKLWSRSVAQAALVLGLAVVIYGILLKTGVIGGDLPSKKTIQDTLTAAAAATGSQ